MLSSTALYAVDTHWQNPGSGNWFDLANWDNGVPNSYAYYAYITNGGEAQIGAGDAKTKHLYLGEGAGKSGALTQTGGTNTVYYLYLGLNSGSEGTYELSGDGSLSAYTEEYIGFSGTGTFTQTGGANKIIDGYNLYLGYSSGAKGTYELSGTGSLSAPEERIGYNGTGAFTQTGGTNTLAVLYLGRHSGSEGTYELSGTGSLSTKKDEYIGYAGTGTFTQTGGANTINGYLYLGYSGAEGTYELSGTGSLSAENEFIGGRGTFTQTGGTNTIGQYLYVGMPPGSKGKYELSGTGSLSAKEEHVGENGTGTFTQTGGSNTTDYLSVNSAGQYVLSGGTVHVTDSANLDGVFDFAGGSATMAVDTGIVNFQRGTLTGTSAATLTVGPNSLTIFPAGFDPGTDFPGFTSSGLVFGASETVVVAAGEGFTGWGQIDNHVQCQGTISATSGRGIDLCGGLAVSAGGAVDLGTGTLTVEDTASGISGADSLLVNAKYYNEYIGYEGTGAFTQTGGTHAIGWRIYLGYSSGAKGTFTQTGGTSTVGGLYLGYSSGSEGTYELSGTGSLSAENEYIGDYGTGTFTQTGGTNTIQGRLYIGRDGGKGTYELSAGSLSAEYNEYVGYYGIGTFTQTGGTHTVTSTLQLGSHLGGEGTYELSGMGSLSAKKEYIGYPGTGTFTQTGGTNTVGGLYLALTSGGEGTYELSGTGSLSADDESIGHYGTGTFTQTGGSHNVTNDLTLAAFSGSQGTYKLLGGTLTVGGNIIRGSGTSQFIIAGGKLNIQTFTADALCLGENEGDSSTFELQEGVLQVADATIGNYGSGIFELTGGTHIVQYTTHIGVWSKSYGCYRISVGALTTNRFLVGEDGVGVLEFLGSSSQVTVTHSITFGKWGGCISIPGSKIHMTGAAFENQSTDPAAMAGLANLELIFEGGAGAVDPFEVASTVNGGFDLNFALGTLTVGGADVGRVRLVDKFNNGNRGAFGAECLFAHHVAIGQGSTLDLNGLRLYVEGDVESFLDGCVADGRLLDGTGAFLDAFYCPGNDWTVVPEPATLALLAFGVAGLILKRRRPVA